jgi:hypothetical protein
MPEDLDRLSAFASRGWTIAAEMRDLMWSVRNEMTPEHMQAFLAASDAWIKATLALEEERAAALGGLGMPKRQPKNKS